MASGAGGMYVVCMSPRVLALLVAGAVLSAGCGQAAVKSSSPAKPKPGQNQGLVAESAAATADAGTAHASYSMRMTGLPGASGGVTASGTGAIDFASRSTELRLHMTVPQAGMTVDMSERLLGTTIYMHSPLLAGATGKPWIKLDLQKFGKAQGLDMSAAMSTGGSDPSQMLSYLNAASDSIDRVGTEDVRGTPTTRYHVVVDLLKVANAVPAAKQAAVRRTFRREVALLGTHTMPIDVWIDSRGLVRREHFDITMTPPSATTPVGMEMTIEFFDFGAPVHIVAPPARQVADLADLASASPSA
jgi:hypothetical protein